MLGLLPLKDWLYIGAIVALVTGFLFYRHSLIVDGEHIAQAREVVAAQEQKARDDKVAKDNVDALNTQITSLSRAYLTGVPSVPIRLCVPSRSVPAGGATKGTANGPPAAPDVLGVLPGAAGGVDIGAAVLDLAYAGAIEAAYRNATVKWAMEQGK